MTLTVTRSDDLHRALRRRIHLRAEWLRGMPPHVREGLGEVTLREVDRRFEAWLDARAPVGDDGGG